MSIETKVFELRDKATFIPIIASLMKSDDERERWLLRRAGYSPIGFPKGVPETYLVLISRLDGGESQYDPYDWCGRTFPNAHKYIEENWSRLASGDLVDVQVILGEQSAPCESERHL